MKKLSVLMAIVSLALLYGCPPKPVSVPISERVQQGGITETRVAPQQEAATDSQREGKISEEELARREAERKKALQEALRTSPLKDIYFEFDSYSIQADYLPVLKDIGAWLNRNTQITVTIEGHCDERGTTEYNLALGQRRAESVRDYLIRLGVSGKQMKAVSYGKEAPADPRRTEEAWAKNRRVHFRAE